MFFYIALFVAVLALFVSGLARVYQTRKKRRRKKKFQEKSTRAHEILKAGGPRTLKEYREIFPDACPRCGSRSRRENPRRVSVWGCCRCQYAPRGKSKNQEVSRSVTSPYVAVDVSDTLPEPLFSGPQHRQIFVQNDDETSMECVVDILQDVFELQQVVAVNIMLETHSIGHSYVITLPTSEAEQKCQPAIEIAQERGYPLTFIAKEGDQTIRANL